MSAPAPRRREADIQVEVLRLLRARGVACWPMNREAGVRRALGNERTTARIGGPGFADIVGIVPWCATHNKPAFEGLGPGCATVGRLFALECKAPKAKTAKRRALAQAAFGATVTAAGGLYLRIDPLAKESACEQVCAAFGWKYA